MYRITKVKPLENFKIWLQFSDGTEGIVDLSNMAGKGVFSVWEDPKIFRSVFIDPETRTIAWPGGIDLCPDSLYAEVSGADTLSRKVTHA